MYRLLLIAALLPLGAACTPTTDIVNSWDPAPKHDGPLAHVMIMAVTPDENARKRYEKYCAEVFEQAGLKVSRTYRSFPNWDDISRESVRAHLEKNTDIDGLITTQLAGMHTASASMPQENIFDRDAIRFYKPAMSYNYTPDVETQPPHPVYMAQSNLYDLRAEALVWTVMTRTPGGMDNDAMSRSQCQALREAMREKGYLPEAS
jgi:hypothetical protein